MVKKKGPATFSEERRSKEFDNKKSQYLNMIILSRGFANSIASDYKKMFSKSEIEELLETYKNSINPKYIPNQSILFHHLYEKIEKEIDIVFKYPSWMHEEKKKHPEKIEPEIDPKVKNSGCLHDERKTHPGKMIVNA